MNARIRAAVCGLAIVAWSSSSLHATIVAPLLEYTLNTADNTTSLPAGASVINTGTAGANGNLTMFGPQAGPPGQTPSNLYTADGGGRSGLPGDRALNNTVAAGMGSLGGYNSSNNGPGAAQTSATTILPNQTALTFTGWIKTQDASTAWGALSQIFEGDGGNFMHINSGDPNLGQGGELTINFQTTLGGGIFSSNTSHTGWTAQGTWMFIGIVWQGGNVGQMDFYNVDGSNIAHDVTTLNSSSLFGAVNPSGETSGAYTYGLALGNQGGARARPFDGYMDDFRVFNTALSAADIQTIVNADLNNTAVPEPATFVMLALGGALWGLAIIRTSRRNPRTV